jgi:hypothetical protein
MQAPGGREHVPDVMAIVSKAVFERDAKHATLGMIAAFDRYNSKHKALSGLRDGGRLFMVTVRPPDEKLWLVAVLSDLRETEAAWVAASPNQTPLCDVTALRSKIRFESGKGMSQDKGALGMSLQTPRTLTADDARMLLEAAGAPSVPATARATPAAAAAPKASAGAGPSDATRSLLTALSKAQDDPLLRERAARALFHDGAHADAMNVLSALARFNAHDASGLPCLCRGCLAPALLETEEGGIKFLRDLVVREGRVLFFWAPAELFTEAEALRNSVRASLGRRFETLARQRKIAKRSRPAF